MAEDFEEKLARVAGTIRPIVMNDPHQRYSGGLLYWSNKAENLHEAAITLGGDPFESHFEAFALLAGFSLEVLIKGILNGLGEKVPFTHDLVSLSKKAGFTTSKNEQAVLKALTIYIKWYSRYPAAKNSQTMVEELAILKAQYPSSGNAQKIAEASVTSAVAVNRANYERLYRYYHQRFFDVHSSIQESAVFSYDPPNS